MSRIVVDTDVVSFIFKNDRRAKKYEPHLIGKEVIVSFMTLAQLRLWMLIRHWGQHRRELLEAHIRKFAIHPFDSALCSVWAQVTYRARLNGRPIDTADAWIAATAKLHGLPLVTHNAQDFEGVDDLTIITEPD